MIMQWQRIIILFVLCSFLKNSECSIYFFDGSWNDGIDILLELSMVTQRSFFPFLLIANLELITVMHG